MKTAPSIETSAQIPCFEDRAALFTQEVRDNSDTNKAPGKDPRIAAFSCAVMLEYTTNPDFQGLIDSTLLAREDILHPSLAVNILLRSLQKQLLRRENLYPRQFPYPEPYDKVLPWRKDIRALSADDVPERTELMHDLRYRYPQSNIVERYKAFSLVLQLMRGQFDRRPNVLDIGCSRNQGLKRLTIPPNEIIPPFSEIKVTGLGGQQKKERQAHIINTILTYTTGIGDSVGVDIEDTRRPENKEWAAACSFYPSELLNAKKVDGYAILDESDPTDVNIDFHQADFATIDLRDFSEQTGHHGFDMVTMCTVLNQVPDAQEREAMLENARGLVKPHGLIVVQDFAHIERGNPTSLQFYDNWFASAYRYRTFILDAKTDFQKFHEIFRWNDGRCSRLQIPHAISRLALAGAMGLGA